MYLDHIALSLGMESAAMRRLSSFVLLFALTCPILAQDTASKLVGDCVQSEAEAQLTGGNLISAVSNNGSLFHPFRFRIPKGSDLNVMFNANLWVGGFIGGELREAGSHYGPFEFWAGPLDDDGLPPADCSSFDSIFEIDADRDMGGSGRGPTSHNLLAWPVVLGAPFIEVDGVAGYDPGEGDRPAMYGDHMLWWVMNDRGNEHLITNSDPLGVEVRATAYSFDSRDVAGNTVFVRYEITNRNHLKIEDMFFGQRIDQDVGLQGELHSATDTTLGMVYSYYMDWDASLFGDSPPAIGITMLAASHSPRNDYARHTSVPKTGFSHSMINWSWLQREVSQPGELYDWLQGRWPEFIRIDNDRLIEGMFGGPEALTSGHEPRLIEGKPVEYMFPGDPVTASYWSMNNYNGGGANLFAQTSTVIGSYGPFDLEPNETFTTTVAFVWSRGSSNLGSVGRLRTDVAYLKDRADELTSSRLVKPTLTKPEQGLQVEFYPNPAGDWLRARIRVPVAVDVTIQFFDALGRRVQTALSIPLQPGEATHEIDIRELPPGLYVTRVQIGTAVGYRSVNIY